MLNPKYRDTDLMDGLFRGGGTGWMVAFREEWSMAQCLDDITDKRGPSGVHTGSSTV